MSKTLKEIIGDFYPLRVCRCCSKRAYTEIDLHTFVYDPRAAHGRRNLCMDCYNLSRGHSKRAKEISCTLCGHTEDPSTPKAHSWFLPRAKVCNVCLGTHIDHGFGALEPITPRPKVIVLDLSTGIFYESVPEASLSTTVRNYKIYRDIRGISSSPRFALVPRHS